MHKPGSILENETQKLHWDFEIQTDYPILARRPDLVLNKKTKNKTYWISDFAISAEHRVKIKENEKRDNHLDPARELKSYGIWKKNKKKTKKKTMLIAIIIGALGTGPKGSLSGLEELEIKRCAETIHSR